MIFDVANTNTPETTDFSRALDRPSDAASSKRASQVMIVALIDALGWSYLKDREFLPDILTFRSEVRTVLGFSSGAIPTLLSGLLPRESGHWNLFYYDPAHSPFSWVRFLGFLPSSALNSRVLRRAIRFISQKLCGFGGYFQIYGVPTGLLPFFDVCEKRDIYRCGGVPSSIFDEVENLGLRYRTYSYHEASDREIIRRACHDLRSGNLNFQFVYLSELDAFLHTSCGDRQAVEHEIARYEEWLRVLYDQAKKSYEEVVFLVCSDHGMTPKESGYDIIGEVEALGFQMPGHYLALYDSTMARFWFFSDTARRQIVSRLDKLACGRILDHEEKVQLGIDFPNHRHGEVVFLMNPGILIEPSFFGKKAPAGMHGFHPDDSDSSAAFLTNRVPDCNVRTLVDVHDVMKKWAGALRDETYAKR